MKEKAWPLFRIQLQFQLKNRTSYPKSAEGNEDNPYARREYEALMIVDPATGQLPENIRSREISFARRILTRGQVNARFRELSTEDFSSTPWSSAGPFNIGGRTRALALDVSNENVFLAGGVSGGMWRSENSGQTWEKVTAPQSLHTVTCIAQDTRNGRQSTWYYGTGEMRGNTASLGDAQYRGDGIFKSTNGGKSWTLLQSTSNGQPHSFTSSSKFSYVWNIVTDPSKTTEDVVYAATFGGIRRSTDGGNSWTLVLGDDIINESSSFLDVAITPTGVLYATLSEKALVGTARTKGIYRSVDGINWVNITPTSLPPQYQRIVIGISPSDPNMVYFIADSNPYFLARYKYISGNGAGAGGEWLLLSNNLPYYDSQKSYNMVIKVHPNDPNTVFLGGVNLYRTTDGFTSFANTTQIGGYGEFGEPESGHFPDQHAIVFFPSNPDRMLSGHDGGISITQNNLNADVKWTSLNNGYVTSQYYTIATGEINGKGFMVGGLQDNGSYYTEATGEKANWTKLFGGDGSYCAYASKAGYIYVSAQDGMVYRYNPANQENIRIDPFTSSTNEQKILFINPFILDPSDDNILYYAGGDRVWVNNSVNSSSSYSGNWESFSPIPVTAGSVSALAASTFPQNRLYFGSTKGKVYRVDNANSSSNAPKEITSSAFPANGYVSCIAVNPRNADSLFVIFSNYNVQSIFFSPNGGKSFTPVSGNLEQNSDGKGNGPSVRWLKIIPLKNNKYYYLVGTSTGLYSSSKIDGMKTIWAMEGEEEIGNVVVAMIDYRPSDGLIAVATHGNGVYTTHIDSVEIVEPTTTNKLNVYPNPFFADGSNTIKVNYKIIRPGQVTIKAFNSEGKEVATLLNKLVKTIDGELEWNGRDSYGNIVPRGIYIIRIANNGKTSSFKIIVNK